MEQAQTIEAAEYYTYETPFFADEPSLHPSETSLEIEGNEYILMKRELLPATSPVESTWYEQSTTLTLEGEEELPDLIGAEIADEEAGIAVDAHLRILNVEATGSHWSEAFTFPVKITDYDADGFLLGDNRIESTANLAEYGDLLLEELGLDTENYRVNVVAWDGPSYVVDGHVFRDATASGQKLMTDYEVTYGGEVSWPELSGWKYRCTYRLKGEEIVEATPSETVLEEVRSAEVPPGKENVLKRLVRWLTERKVMAFSLAAIFVLFANVFLLLWYRRKKTKEKEERWDETSNREKKD